MTTLTINCSLCGISTPKTSNGPQKYCPDCRKIAAKKRKIEHYKKNNPNAYAPIEKKFCSVCDNPYACSYQGVPYCNKHYLKMYKYGTLEPVRKKTNRYEISGDIVTFFTTKGEPFIVDKEDFDKVYGSTWCFNRSGRYLVARINKKVIRLHRYILDVTDSNLVVDHINGSTSDNRRSNLRITTQINNARNNRISKNNSSGYHGVDKRPSGKYRARITVNRKEILLGTFTTYEEAVRVRKEAELKYFGEYSPSKGVLK